MQNFILFFTFQGRSFSGLIKNFLKTCDHLNNDYIPAYKTDKGKKIYDETLQVCKQNFPQYVKELEGIADGAEVDFYKVICFLLLFLRFFSLEIIGVSL